MCNRLKSPVCLSFTRIKHQDRRTFSNTSRNTKDTTTRSSKRQDNYSLPQHFFFYLQALPLHPDCSLNRTKLQTSLKTMTRDLPVPGIFWCLVPKQAPKVKVILTQLPIINFLSSPSSTSSHLPSSSTSLTNFPIIYTSSHAFHQLDLLNLLKPVPCKLMCVSLNEIQRQNAGGKGEGATWHI